MLSFVIPAHNEELTLRRAIESIQQSTATIGQPFEIIVVDDASTDRTGEIAMSLGAQVVKVDLRHIAAARNAGAKAAHGETLIFVDADTTITSMVLSSSLAEIEQGAVGGGARVRLKSGAPLWGRIAWTISARVYFSFNLAAGCFMFVRRDAFDVAGGFDEQYFASEEVHLSIALKQHGKFVVVRESVATSDRKFHIFSAREILREAYLIVSTRGAIFRSRHRWWYGSQRVESPRKD